MAIDKTETVILVILEMVGLVVAMHGFMFQYSSNVTTSGVIYCTVWYILGGLSHLLGMVAIFMEGMEDELKGDSQAVLQYHYLTGWLSVIVGYPLLVTFTWMMLFPESSILVQFHLMLSLIPVLSWWGQYDHGTVRSTQLCIGLAAASHFFVCMMAGDIWGVATAVVMVVKITALSTPTRFHVWAFNSRELFIIGLVISSVLINISIMNLGRPLNKIKVISNFYENFGKV